MSGACRLTDQANCPADVHGCSACSHNVTGPVMQGSTDTFINSHPMARQSDTGIHGTCCGPNRFTIATGSPTVNINGRAAARDGDRTSHCGGFGKIRSGSKDTVIGNSQAAGFKNAAKSHAPFVCNCGQ